MKNKFLLVILLVIVISVLVGCDANVKVDISNNTNKGATNNDSNASSGAINNTEPSETVTVEEALKQLPDISELTYSQYMALTPELQEAIKNTFASEKDFVVWLSEIKATEDAFNEFLNGSQNTTEGTETAEPTGDGSTNQPTIPPQNNADGVTFLEYQAMSAAEQQRFIASFGSVEAFMAWHAAAVQEYKDSMKEWGSSNTSTEPTDITEPAN